MLWYGDSIHFCVFCWLWLIWVVFHHKQSKILPPDWCKKCTQFVIKFCGEIRWIFFSNAIQPLIYLSKNILSAEIVWFELVKYLLLSAKVECWWKFYLILHLFLEITSYAIDNWLILMHNMNNFYLIFAFHGLYNFLYTIRYI